MKSMKSVHQRLNKRFTAIFLGKAVALAAICLVVTGCALVEMQKEYDKSLGFIMIIGRIYGNLPENVPIVVAARSTHIAAYTVLHGPGEYEIAVPRGSYHVFAYQDLNSNLVYEKGEPAGQHGSPTLVRAPAVGVVYDIDIKIPEKGQKIVVPHGTEISSTRPQKLYSRQAGAIARLDEERFAEEHGVKGFWEPVSFFSEQGGNIYFLEEYDPDKIPILFIHGATGTPRGWQYMVDHIDRDRFQPWFFYYPTGARIDSIANLLYWKLINLQTKYQFKKMYITAHSMGGLVARSFLVNYGRRFPFVKLFISLATPWGGDHMAELGVKQSPVLIPSWIDMQPNGDFIKSLYRKKLPEDVRFYMFYGYKGSRNPLRSNNDGTITLSSLLDARPQSEAQMNYAFNEDHASLLLSEEVVTQYNAILNEFYEDQDAAPARSGGYLKVNFSYDYEFTGIRPMPLLVLVPDGKNSAEIVTFLNNDDSGKSFGPFPPGTYFAAMAVMSAKPGKKWVPVRIENNKTEELDFVFAPDGEIFGCVTAAMKRDEKFLGRPDMIYRSVDENIHIRDIRLEGEGIQRQMQAIAGKPAKVFLVEREDYCFSKCFGFFNLPAGNYKLTISAQGYQDVEEHYCVEPGKPKYYRVTELSPE